MRKVPTSYGSLTLEQYLKVIEILESKNNDFDKRIQLITYFTGVDADEIPFRQPGIKRLYIPSLTVLLKRADKLINSEKPKSVKSVVWIGNSRYKAVLDATSLNTNQFTALCTYAQSPDKNIVKALSVLLYKYPLFSTASFKDSDIKDIEKALMKARLKDVYGILLFFCLVYEQLSAISPAYLLKASLEIEQTMKDLMAEVMPNSEKSTGGTTS